MQILIDFFDVKNFIPHGYCLSWSPLLLWLHVSSDLLITLSYYFIPLSLAYFVRKRKELPYYWLLVMFASFIVACGTTHLLSAITIWIPLYWLDGYIKAFTALISAATAVSTIWVIPLILKLPTTAQLQAEIERNKLLDEERQQALKCLQKIANRVPGVVYQFRLNEDGSSCFPYASSAIYDIYRVTPEEVVHSADKVFAILHPEDYDQVVVSIMQSAENLTPWKQEYRVRFQDGTENWLLGNALPERQDDGATLWHGFITDISERKYMEQQLLNNQAFASSILNSLTAHIAVLDAEGTIILVNTAWQKFAEQNSLPNASQTGWNYFENSEKGLSEDDKEIIEILEGTKSVLDGKLPTFHTEYPCHSPTEESWFHMTVSPLQNTEAGIVITHENISERKRAEIQLRIAATVFEAHEGMLITDANSIILNVNQAFTRITGYEPEEVIGRTPRILTSGRQNTAFYIALWKSIVETGAWQGEIWNRRKNGEVFPEWLTISAVTANNDGVVTHYVATHTDITERKRIEDNLRKSQTLLQTAQRAAKLGHYVFDIQSRDAITWTNDAQFDEIFGLDEHFVRDLANLPLFIHPDDLQLVVDNFQRTFDRSRSNPTDTMEHRVIRPKDGEERWIEQWGYSTYDEQGNPVQQVGMIQDITERKQAETELRIAATVFDSQEAILIADTNYHILKINQAFTNLTGYSADEVKGQTPRFLRSGKHEEQFFKLLWETVHETGSWQGEIWNRYKNGEIHPQHMTITAVKTMQDIVTHYVASFTDITERKATEEHINRLAFYDPLTQLPNRRLLHERLKHSIEVSRRSGKHIAVLMMDLDKFKAVNDSFGHAAGDDLLQQVAMRVKALLRETDMVARLGGDEFVILIEDVSDYKHIARIANSIIHALSRSFTLYELHKVYIGASIGIALYSEHGDTVETLLDNADAALYYAKEQGRGCFAYFSEEFTQKAHERLALESRLRNAIEQHELHIYFQPQIDINSGLLVGVEALVRWNDSVNGYLSNSEFIALAEETGQIVTLGEWVLNETCKLGRKWLNNGFPAIAFAVNVSPLQFRRCNMKTLVTKILHETDFPANQLELEISETCLMDNQTSTLPILNSLHEQGIGFAIDSFGTGYSSLGSLNYLPINRLKIAKNFIDNLPFSQNDAVITSTIISMAHHLGFKVLAEGVETLEQLEFLREQGCDSYQGYLYSEASAIDNAEFKLLMDNVETHKQLTFLREYSCSRYQGHLHTKILSTSEFVNSFNSKR
jgi:diguanylate cyclase (GGDEF)-like protein/PAS domain S-box-containing protein